MGSTTWRIVLAAPHGTLLQTLAEHFKPILAQAPHAPELLAVHLRGVDVRVRTLLPFLHSPACGAAAGAGAAPATAGGAGPRSARQARRTQRAPPASAAQARAREAALALLALLHPLLGG
jgi:hypothetical protein